MRRWLYRDWHSLAGYSIFLITALVTWRPYVRKHEGIYLLGAKRVADPELLAADLTWGDPLPPTTFLHDHLVAPLWSLLGDFGAVAIGRLVAWALLAWSLALLSRCLRLPPWSLPCGFAVWLLIGQSILSCGSFLEGFQPKSFAYPLVLFALVLAIRGRTVGAGLTAGLATAFHVIVGGWGCLAVFATLLLDRERFSYRRAGVFLLSAAPFVVPLLLALVLFHSGGVSADEAASMDEIYVTFAAPHCCDPAFFMSDDRWMRVLGVLPLAPLMLFFWPERRAGRIVTWFVLVLVGLFWLGMLAALVDGYTLLKLLPFQWANGVAPLFLFVMALAYFGTRPERTGVQVVWLLALLVAGWLSVNREAFTKQLPRTVARLVESRDDGERGKYGSGPSSSRRELYRWIRNNTERDAVFATPYMPEFWIYAERAQVASVRHPPSDKRLIEWRRRLERLNGRPFRERGFEITDELDDNQRALSARALADLHARFGADYYVTRRARSELERFRLFSAGRYSVYSLQELAPLF